LIDWGLTALSAQLGRIVPSQYYNVLHIINMQNVTCRVARNDNVARQWLTTRKKFGKTKKREKRKKNEQE